MSELLEHVVCTARLTLSSTNASPIYIVLFLTATYALQRPCVYCSILLFVLVFSLFDFHADWFEPRWQPSAGGPTLTETAGSLLDLTIMLPDILGKILVLGDAVLVETWTWRARALFAAAAAASLSALFLLAA